MFFGTAVNNIKINHYRNYFIIQISVKSIDADIAFNEKMTFSYFTIAFSYLCTAHGSNASTLQLLLFVVRFQSEIDHLLCHWLFWILFYLKSWMKWVNWWHSIAFPSQHHFFFAASPALLLLFFYCVHNLSRIHLYFPDNELCREKKILLKFQCVRFFFLVEIIHGSSTWDSLK